MPAARALGGLAAWSARLVVSFAVVSRSWRRFFALFGVLLGALSLRTIAVAATPLLLLPPCA